MSSSPRFSRWSFKQNKRPDRSNGDQYYYITDFNQVSDKDCIQYDKLNDKIYMDNLKLFNDINKKLSKSIIKVTEKPSAPPRPNNYERLFLWRQRNIKLSVEDQTIAILYLLSKTINIKLPNSIVENGIEPWEAINTADEISSQLNENKKEIALKYLNIINNIFKNEKDEKVIKNSTPEKNQQEIISNMEVNYPNELDQNEIHNSCNQLICSNPEHHNVNHKIDHFNTIKKNKKTNRSSRLYPVLNDRELPMNMNFHLNVDNGITPVRRESMYLPEPRINFPSAPSAPPPVNDYLPPGYQKMNQ